MKCLVAASLLSYGVAFASDSPKAEVLHFSAPDYDVFNVKAFGARGDDAADDSAAINFAIQAARNSSKPLGSNQGAGQASRIVFPVGIYRISASGINATGLRSLNIAFEMQGATIDCQVVGGICFDATFSQFLRFNGLSIVGSSTKTPRIGIQIARKNKESSDTIYLERPVTTGYFSFAAFYNFGSELNTIVSPAFYNLSRSPTSFTMVLDGVNYWNARSAYVDITAETSKATSFTATHVISGSIMGNSGATPIWASNLSFSDFDHTYIERGSTGSAFTLFMTPSWPIVDFSCVCHFETFPFLQNIFLIDGPPATVNGQLRGINYADEYPEASNALFKVSSNLRYVSLLDGEFRIDNFLVPKAKVFDDPTIWFGNARYTENVGSHWNGITGQILADTNQQGIKKLTASTISLIGLGEKKPVAKINVPPNISMSIGPTGPPTNGAILNLLTTPVINGGVIVGNGGYIPRVTTSGTKPLLLGAPGLSGAPVVASGAFYKGSTVFIAASRVTLGAIQAAATNTDGLVLENKEVVAAQTVRLPALTGSNGQMFCLSSDGGIVALTLQTSELLSVPGALTTLVAGVGRCLLADGTSWHQQ